MAEGYISQYPLTVSIVIRSKFFFNTVGILSLLFMYHYFLKCKANGGLEMVLSKPPFIL